MDGRLFRPERESTPSPSARPRFVCRTYSITTYGIYSLNGTCHEKGVFPRAYSSGWRNSSLPLLNSLPGAVTAMEMSFFSADSQSGPSPSKIASSFLFLPPIHPSFLPSLSDESVSMDLAFSAHNFLSV